MTDAPTDDSTATTGRGPIGGGSSGTQSGVSGGRPLSPDAATDVESGGAAVPPPLDIDPTNLTGAGVEASEREAASVSDGEVESVSPDEAEQRNPERASAERAGETPPHADAERMEAALRIGGPLPTPEPAPTGEAAFDPGGTSLT